MVTFRAEQVCDPGEPALTGAAVGVTSAGDEASTWTAYVGKVLSAATSYFPAQVSDMMSQDRAFATVHLLKTDQRNVCALATWVVSAPSLSGTQLV